MKFFPLGSDRNDERAMMRRLCVKFSIAFTCVSAILTSAATPVESTSALPAATPTSASNAIPVAASAGELMQSTPIPVIATTRKQMWMEVTAYCACPRCCGPHASGITASGLPVTYNLGRFVAADSAVLPLGSTISVPGYHNGHPVPVIDRGGAIKGNKLDVFFPSHEQALQWGRRWVLVTVEEPVEKAS